MRPVMPTSAGSHSWRTALSPRASSSFRAFTTFRYAPTVFLGVPVCTYLLTEDLLSPFCRALRADEGGRRPAASHCLIVGGREVEEESGADGGGYGGLVVAEVAFARVAPDAVQDLDGHHRSLGAKPIRSKAYTR